MSGVSAGSCRTVCARGLETRQTLVWHCTIYVLIIQYRTRRKIEKEASTLINRHHVLLGVVAGKYPLDQHLYRAGEDEPDRDVPNKVLGGGWSRQAPAVQCCFPCANSPFPGRAVVVWCGREGSTAGYARLGSMRSA